VVSILREGWDNPATGETETLMNAPTMFQAAQPSAAQSASCTTSKERARSLRREIRRLVPAGGRSRASGPRLFMLYAPAISSITQDTPTCNWQSTNTASPSSTAITYDIDLYDALRSAWSRRLHHRLESQRRALPLDVLMHAATPAMPTHFRIDRGPYFHDSRTLSAALRARMPDSGRPTGIPLIARHAPFTANRFDCKNTSTDAILRD